MRVQASTRNLEIRPGTPATLSISVYNSRDVICGYTFEMLGVDAAWLDLDRDQLNLFPDDVGTVTLTLSLPPDFPAGRRHLAVVVRSALDPDEYRIVEVDIEILANPQARLELEPSNFYGGGVGTFGMVITNTGNSWARVVPVAEEQEAKAKIELRPTEVDVPPGEQVTVTAEVRRRRPWFGSAETRILNFRVDGVEEPPQAVGSFTQRPLIGRGLLALCGLLAALSVFGFVLTKSLGLLVDRSEAGNDALLSAISEQDAASEQLAAAIANPSSLGGVVTSESATGSAPVANVTVQLFSADDESEPIGNVATDSEGRYSFDPIIGGTYKVRVVGAGLAATWYPGAESFEEAEDVVLDIGQDLDAVDISITRRPGLISGTVLADDPSDVVIALVQLQGDARVATVREVTTDASGTFVLEDIPLNIDDAGAIEPYELVATKEGFAEERRLITVEEGSVQDDIRIRLRTGDARLSGTVTLAGRPADDDELIEVVATADDEQYSTVTFDGGRYVFRDLPSPALYSITASRDGFTTETRTRQVDSGAVVSGVDIDLDDDTRAIRGTVVSATTDRPVPGALVTATDGQSTVRARTGSDGIYELRGLDPLSTYALTASHPSYRDMTLSCAPAAQGCSGSGAATDFRFRLRLATSTVSGIVCNRQLADGAATVTPLGGVTVELSSATYEARTVSVNAAASGTRVSNPYVGAPCALSAAATAAGRLDGFYRFLDVPVGIYTITFTREGGLPFTQVIRVPTSEPVHQVLIDTSSITVRVVDGGGDPVAGAVVDVFTRSSFEANPDGAPTMSTVTGSAGVARFLEVDAPEEYVVIIRYLRPGDEEEQRYSRSFPLRVGESKSETITVVR